MPDRRPHDHVGNFDNILTDAAGVTQGAYREGSAAAAYINAAPPATTDAPTAAAALAGVPWRVIGAAALLAVLVYLLTSRPRS